MSVGCDGMTTTTHRLREELIVASISVSVKQLDQDRKTIATGALYLVVHALQGRKIAPDVEDDDDDDDDDKTQSLSCGDHAKNAETGGWTQAKTLTFRVEWSASTDFTFAKRVWAPVHAGNLLFTCVSRSTIMNDDSVLEKKKITPAFLSIPNLFFLAANKIHRYAVALVDCHSGCAGAYASGSVDSFVVMASALTNSDLQTTLPFPPQPQSAFEELPDRNCASLTLPNFFSSSDSPFLVRHTGKGCPKEDVTACIRPRVFLSAMALCLLLLLVPPMPCWNILLYIYIFFA